MRVRGYRTLKLSPTTNAFLWALLGVMAFAGVPMTLLRPGELGFLPLVASIIAGCLVLREAYNQWRTQQITLDFIKLIPAVLAGAAFAFLIAAIGRQFS